MKVEAAALEGSRIALSPDTVEALSSAVGAASMLGASKAQTLLELPDEDLGRLMKTGIAQVLKFSAQLTFNVQKHKKRTSLERTGAGTSETGIDFAALDKQAAPARKKLVASGQLLPAKDTWEALQMTRQALGKATREKRIFNVDVGPDQYYPAFYVTGSIDRKTLGKVTKLLGDLPGWSKWQFFTLPKGSLGDITPLEALERGQLEQVESAALAFAER
ncbi:hypothetical protein KTD31_02420 [Burkholderia multivorans]|uniref:hypothetical protein n=1 Tax=Burkholderia multivorans TaxID=87883 RepID=UPI001C227065|nr:hypothetical protein [Burkholderia multivorans]MBU9200260.1 hypothetical protein [Burkholderia multivorans]MDN8078613.1 hypothetical protein [Burkholderia multivorans]